MNVLFQYADLMKKRKIVLNDKAKIAAVIAELDQKKNEALKKAWEQVNKVRKLWGFENRLGNKLIMLEIRKIMIL